MAVLHPHTLLSASKPREKRPGAIEIADDRDLVLQLHEEGPR